MTLTTHPARPRAWRGFCVSAGLASQDDFRPPTGLRVGGGSSLLPRDVSRVVIGYPRPNGRPRPIAAVRFHRWQCRPLPHTCRSPAPQGSVQEVGSCHPFPRHWLAEVCQLRSLPQSRHRSASHEPWTFIFVGSNIPQRSRPSQRASRQQTESGSTSLDWKILQIAQLTFSREKKLQRIHLSIFTGL